MPPPDAVRPAALRCGDTVRLVSPAGPPSRERVARGIELLSGWGLRVEVSPHAFDRHGYLAGRDEDRLADLNAALVDPSVRAVVCTRGGYGTQRIVDGLDAEAVRRDPKLVVGFSDITGLQLALWRIARLVTIHGPGGAWSDARTGRESAESLRATLFDAEPTTLAADPSEPTAKLRVPGTAHGPLLGGNLSLLAASLSTVDMPDLTGAILLLEDVGEAPYRVDRMLTQLRRSGRLADVGGVAIGQFTDCTGRPDELDVVDVLADVLTDLGVPMLGGLPVGHGTGQRTVALGVPATLDVTAGTLTLAAATTPSTRPAASNLYSGPNAEAPTSTGL